MSAHGCACGVPGWSCRFHRDAGRCGACEGAGIVNAPSGGAFVLADCSACQGSGRATEFPIADRKMPGLTKTTTAAGEAARRAG